MNLLGWPLSSTSDTIAPQQPPHDSNDENQQTNLINQDLDNSIGTSPIHITREHLSNEHISDPPTPTSDNGDATALTNPSYIAATGVDMAASATQSEPDSDHVLDSDTQSVSPRSISPRSISPDSVSVPPYIRGSYLAVAKINLVPTLENKHGTFENNSGQKQVLKTCSTGDLRMYHKTDLKNKICAAEHRILQLEKKLATVEQLYRSLAITTKHNKQENDAARNFKVPDIIKVIAVGVLFLQIGNIFK